MKILPNKNGTTNQIHNAQVNISLSAPNVMKKGSPKGLLGGPLGAPLGAEVRPKTPKDPPRAPQVPPRIPQCPPRTRKARLNHVFAIKYCKYYI